MMITVTDPQLRVSLILHLLEKINNGEFGAFEPEDNAETIDKLRQMNASNLIRLCSLGVPEVQLRIDSSGMAGGIETLARQDSETTDLIYFISNGASTGMMTHLFRAKTEVINGYRRVLGCDRKVGRTALPSHRVREEIQMAWHELIKKQPVQDSLVSLRKNIRLVHEQFADISIDILYATINEFE